MQDFFQRARSHSMACFVIKSKVPQEYEETVVVPLYKHQLVGNDGVPMLLVEHRCGQRQDRVLTWKG